MDISLNGDWKFSIDHKNLGISENWFSLDWIQAHFANLESIIVPSNINTHTGLDKFIGTAWFFYVLPEIPYHPRSHEYGIEFKGVNYSTDIWLNGSLLGHHEGGCLPFRVSFSPRLLSLSKSNFLAVRVDCSLSRNGIPPIIFDGYHWGGIYRDVVLLVLEKTRVKRIKIQTTRFDKKESIAELKVEFIIKNPQEFLNRCYAELLEPQVEYKLYYLGRFFNGEQQFNQVLIQTGIQDLSIKSLPSLKHIPHNDEALKEYFKDAYEKDELVEEPVDLETYFSNSQKKTSLSNIEEELLDEKPREEESMEEELNTIFSITVQNPALWSPDHPELYQLTLKLHGVDQDKDIRFGIRTISKTASQIMLNGNPIRINGISFPEELLPYGRNYPIQQRRREVLDLKALGINAIHTPYLPHDKSLVEVADEEGILLIEEVPLSKYSHFAEKGDLINGMVENLILRDFNNPSVIIWSLGENLPINKSETANILNAIIKNSKVIDSSRLFTYFSDHLYVDKCRKNLDLVIFNLPDNLRKKQIEKLYIILNKVRRKNRHLPIILAGFSQEAQYGIRSADAKPFSEDSQLYKTLPYLKLANSIPFITGWIFSSYRDYRSVLYTKKYRDGFARNGLYNEKNQPKLIYSSLGNLIDNKFDTEFPKVKFLWIKMKFSQFFERLSLKFHPINQKRLEKKISSYYLKSKQKSLEHVIKKHP